jgi:signal transduction histidine kinase
VLVSIVDARKNEEIFAPAAMGAKPFRLSYEQNSLVFRPFSGGYAWRRPPFYRFRVDGAGPWSELDAGSTFGLSDLDAGRHVLEIQTSENREGPSATREVSFEILPPWYQTWLAYGLYGLGGIMLILAVIGLASYLARRRHRALEAQVRARTCELEVAMGRLNDETRNAATLAERNRMAGEIHDSMQQGLSGAIIQLDTTLKMRTVTDDVRSRLNVVRNMISYARHEVQHVVWDMESPLLEGTELGEALRKITALINVGTVTIETRVEGVPVDLPRATKHHLLRLAQETTTNAVRHAEASHITIELQYAPEAIVLTVVDDGIGFVLDEMRFKTFGHFGLRGLRARAEKISGQLTIESAPGAGTLVRIVVPLRAGVSLPSHAEAYSSDKNTHPFG